MPPTAPTTAERVRSACARAAGALLAIESEDPVATPVHHLFDDGSFAIALPVDSAGETGRSVVGAPALLELTDYAPLPLREPIRSLVWVRGCLAEVPPEALTPTLDRIASDSPNPVRIETPRSTFREDERRYTVLRLEAASVVVTDASGAESVSVAELLTARPDPFCEIESTLLWHLDTAHNDVVARLVSRLPAPLRRGRVRPLGIDRFGVRFRVERADGDHDVRLPFHRPVRDMAGLRQAIHVLMGCPFRNGLRAGR